MRLGAVGEGVELEHADRAVPDDGAGRLAAARRSSARGLRADVEDQVVGRDVGARPSRWPARRPRRPWRMTTSTGIGTSAPRAFIASITALRLADAGRARPAILPIGRPAASMKVLAMPPPTISWSTLSARLCRMVSLVETLRAGDDRDQRPLRAAPAPCVMRVDLGGQQRAGAGDLARTARCRRCEASARCAVPKASCTKMSHSAAIFCASAVVVLLLALVEAAVLEQHDLARLRRRRRRPSRAPAAPSRPSSSPRRLRHRRQRILGLELAFGRAAEVRGHHHRGAGVQRHAGCTAPRRGCACLR